MPLQWRNQIWQSLDEGAGKRCSECDRGHVGRWPNLLGAPCRSGTRSLLGEVFVRRTYFGQFDEL